MPVMSAAKQHMHPMHGLETVDEESLRKLASSHIRSKQGSDPSLLLQVQDLSQQLVTRNNSNQTDLSLRVPE